MLTLCRSCFHRQLQSYQWRCRVCEWTQRSICQCYRGLGNKELVRGGGGNPYPKRLYPNGYPDTFPYNTIPSENYYTYKGGRALDGYEIGFARSFFKNARWARAYVNGYRWNGNGFSHKQEYNWGRPGHWSVPWFTVTKC